MPNVYYSTTTSALTNGDLIWSNWMVNGTSTGTSISNTVWTQWNTHTVTYKPYYLPPQRVPTPEEQEALRVAEEARRAEWARQEEVRKAEEAEAKRKARIVLEEHLNDEQRKQLADNAWFEVVTAKATYRIRTGWSGNVDRIVDGRATDRYCIHPSESVPHEDNMLAQKLLLEADEEAFLRIANRSTPYA